ncbi:hypothetical protein [Jeotgalibaca porci]|uniref:hypothetical protein n=1 Tax=Jeotgalibaca porci TaxID=1868793 RepID=UPI0035A0AEE6
MNKIKFKLNSSGVRSLLQSNEMQAVLDKQATAIRNRAGVGYQQDTYIGKNRANAMVWAETFQAQRDNMKNNTLLKAVR